MGEDVQYKSGTFSVQASKSSSFGTGGTTQEYSPMNEIISLTNIPSKMASSLW